MYCLFPYVYVEASAPAFLKTWKEIHYTDHGYCATGNQIARSCIMVLPNFFTNQIDNDMNFSKQRLQPFKIIYCSLFCPLVRQVLAT